MSDAELDQIEKDAGAWWGLGVRRHIRVLVAEVRQLRARAAELEASRENLLRQQAVMQREVWDLEARVAELEAALKPFAFIAIDCPELDDGIPVRPTGYQIWPYTPAAVPPRMADCRRAAVVLKEK